MSEESLRSRLLPQVLYAIKEYACTAIDVMARRTRLGFLNVQAADEALPRIVQIMGKELNWSQEKKTVPVPITNTGFNEKYVKLKQLHRVCESFY